ncbi:MAG: hypothetical protein ACLU9T_17775 [Blautia faecis]
MELYEYCMAQPEIPDVAMEFSNDNVTAYIDGNEQRTEEIKFKADSLQNITMKLPSGVVFHNAGYRRSASAAGAKRKGVWWNNVLFIRTSESGHSSCRFLEIYYEGLYYEGFFCI